LSTISSPGGSRIYLRLSVTDRCNLRCAYCRPADGSPPKDPDRASGDELLKLVESIHGEFPIGKLRLTGGEPLLADDLPQLTRQIRAILPHTQIGMTTNGLLLPRYARPLLEAGLESLNISLDTLSEHGFRDLTRGGQLARTVDGLRAAAEAGFVGIKLNAVLLRTVNGDQLCNLLRLAAGWGCEIRFIELMPTGEGAHLFDREYMSAEEAHKQLTSEFDYLGSEPNTGTARRHRLRVDGRPTIVGYIPTVSEPFCEGCDRYRLDVRGRLYACLRDGTGQDLLTPWRAGQTEVVAERIHAAMSGKTIPLGVWPTRLMVGVGG
jgi:cyclic pyranopterin phosphate synthase